MIVLDPTATARVSIAPAGRPATTILFDSADLRLVVFRLLPGQTVPPHRSASSVMLTVLAGEGWISGPGEERACKPGDVVCYAPKELHGMNAGTEEFHLLATITPRPGERAGIVPRTKGAA